MLTNTARSPYARVHPLPFRNVRWTEGFWQDVIANNAANTVPHLQSMFEAKDISHVVENFRICAGDSEGTFGGTNFGDGDFYKWMEAAMYTAVSFDNHELLARLDEYVDLIRRAQQPDGYISTKQIIGEREQNGTSRLGDINDFEVYNFGHLFTAACLYYRLTGKDSLLAVAEKAAGYLQHMYQENARTGQVQTAVCPSHYMGLIELYRTTENRQYLDLAGLAIALRDSVTDGTDDNQDRIPLKDHQKIVGHAVRSNYLYAGTADLYAETGDREYKSMLDQVWHNLIHQKLYITGGCGALYNGVSPYGNFFADQKVHQAYGYEYQLPNLTAYNETCASVGSVLWAYRMFQADPQAEYFDLIERTMFNTNLAAVSLDGKKYFYENMLRRAKKLDYELVWPLTRSEYILSYCCPPNLARTLAESAEYAYLQSTDTVWFGMYGSGTASIIFDEESSFTLIQSTSYPYDGRISIHFKDIQIKRPVTFQLRIPGWAVSGWLEAGKERRQLTSADAGTYYPLVIDDLQTASITLQLDMPARLTISHPLVEETTGQAAVERGPLVYCIESPDVAAETLDRLRLPAGTVLTPQPYAVSGRNMTALTGELLEMILPADRPDALYQTLEAPAFRPVTARFIPYFAWDNRGFGEMRIWLPLHF